jgi:transposase-like protein
VRLSVKTGQILQNFKQVRHRLRIKEYKPQSPGELLQTDSIKIRFNGGYKYLITAIDLKSRFAFVKTTNTLNSLQAKNFIEEVKNNAPFRVERVQTDNGGEFEKRI